MEQANEYNQNNIRSEKLLGRGAFGEVYSGSLKSNGKKIAIKRVSKKTMRQYNFDYMKKAFDNELDCMKKCNCENSVYLYNFFETQNNYNIIMELCDGDLDQELRKRPEGFNTDEVRYIFSQLNNAFKKMVEHNIIHRDLKLGNILIKYSDEAKTKFVPKLSDYGFSKELSDKSGITRTNLGTPSTMAPEVKKGKYNNKVDLWSIGVLMYQLHFNEYPYKGRSHEEILRNIKNQIPYKQAEDFFLRDLINKLLVENPENRLSWEQYFEHPFFDINTTVYIGKDKRYIYIKDFDLGFKSDSFKCVIAKDTAKNKLVFIKIYNDEFTKSHNIFLKNEFNLLRAFNKNKSVLPLISKHIMILMKKNFNYLIKNY